MLKQIGKSGQTDYFVDRIYIAGARPEGWTEVLESTARHHGARGANLIRMTPAGLHLLSTPAVREMTEKFAAEGWNDQNSRVTRLLDRSPYPGFLCDCDLHSKEELEGLPMYRHFLNPHGVAAGAATIVQGAKEDSMILAFEAFGDHPASIKAKGSLDALRPHFARAMILSAEVEMVKARSVLEAFEVMRCPVALLGRDNAIVGANASFAAAADNYFRIPSSRLVCASRRSQPTLEAALRSLSESRAGASMAIHHAEDGDPMVLHLVPCPHLGDNPFGTVQAFAVLARPGNKSLPAADLLGALFDLTPTEAAVARLIAGGQSPKSVAEEMALSIETVRTHLKRVFQKASVNSQSQLAALIVGVG